VSVNEIDCPTVDDLLKIAACVLDNVVLRETLAPLQPQWADHQSRSLV